MKPPRHSTSVDHPEVGDGYSIARSRPAPFLRSRSRRAPSRCAPFGASSFCFAEVADGLPDGSRLERASGGNRDRSRALAAYRERDAASGKEPRVLAASNRAGKRCSSAARCGDVSSRTGARSAWQGLGSVSPDPVVTGLGRPAKPEDDRVAQTSRAANAPAAIVRSRRSSRSIADTTNTPPISSSLMQPRPRFERATLSSLTALRFTARADGTISPSSANRRPMSKTSPASDSSSATRSRRSAGRSLICRRRLRTRSAVIEKQSRPTPSRAPQL